MLRTRVIPCLLLEDEGLVKSINFKKPTYIGDPINSVRIYNELEVDELIFLDIKASINSTPPPFKKLEMIASECFMPFSYGGGIRTLDDVKKLFDLGVEKVVLNTIACENLYFITQIADIYGSQSVIISIDVKKPLFGQNRVYIKDGTKKSQYTPIEYVKIVENYGAGEIMLNSIDKEGLMDGFDLALIDKISDAIDIPLIATGGAGELLDIKKAKDAGASAIALGSMAVYQNKNRGILINFPTQKELTTILNED
ncbi:imidazole glycerol phosphate synthase subunit HisF [Sulfurovum sp. bin170]|uniref:AglZ/HisF2 family acetamidino modification protein n=1 Tax=Sulfurovum sp. bin170 TaxID=2695268 RepID=UPI0013DFAFA2|nr:AglZ/HisF2 family acetamidino modification protein [Sulfurovum sp. bin170]NEW60731.1 imidazole glycerol phosphate synthase subunit HisF [Sulfurovum sp. bin170]